MVNNVENKLKEKISAIMDAQNELNAYVYGAEYEQKYQKYQELMKESVNSLITHIQHRFDISNRRYIKALSVDSPIVDRETAKHCVYLGNKYVGQIYVDEYGNVFGSPHDVMERYGDNVVFFSEGTHRQIEFAYIPELDMMAAAGCYVSMDARTTTDMTDDERIIAKYRNYKEQWNCGKTKYVLVDKDLNAIDLEDECPRYYWYRHLFSQLSNPNAKPVGLMDAVKKMWNLDSGVVNVGGNEYVSLDCVDNVIKYKNYNAKLEHKSGKIQNKIDSLVTMKDFESEHIIDRMPHEYENMCSKTVINRINDNTCVIRWVYNYKDETFDGLRVYIEGNDVYACKKNNKGEFIKVALSTLNQKNFTSAYAQEIEMDDMNGTRLQYYASVINEIPNDLRVTMLVLFLSDVRIEQLVKNGFGPAIYDILRNVKVNVSTAIKNAALTNEEGKNVNQWLGINKYQLKHMLDFCNKHNAPGHLIDMMGYMKKLFFAHNVDISCVDNKIFDEALASYEGFYNNHAEHVKNNGYYNIIHPEYVSSFVKENTSDENKALERNLCRYLPSFFTMTEWNARYFSYYTDYMRMVKTMGIRQKVKLYPKTNEELIRMHDDASAAYNLHKNEYKKREFIAQLNKVDKMEYENDDFDFCVVLPKGPEDLVVEGIELSHCVKSYINRVAAGQTNILFIRRKDDKNKPFFTVELTNDRVISQVHGFANRNADTEPGMTEFVERWARNKRLKVGAINHVA